MLSAYYGYRSRTGQRDFQPCLKFQMNFGLQKKEANINKTSLTRCGLICIDVLSTIAYNDAYAFCEMSTHVKTDLHPMYGVETRDYINDQLKINSKNIPWCTTNFPKSSPLRG